MNDNQIAEREWWKIIHAQDRRGAEMGHTPGPWKIGKRIEEDNTLPILGGGRLLGLAYVAPRPFYEDNQAANARLIAEAPAMLSLVAWLAERGTGWGQPMDAKVIEARSIIARIEGTK